MSATVIQENNVDEGLPKGQPGNRRCRSREKAGLWPSEHPRPDPPAAWPLQVSPFAPCAQDASHQIKHVVQGTEADIDTTRNCPVKPMIQPFRDRFDLKPFSLPSAG